MKNRYILLFILILAVITRFLYLDRIPVSINGDELAYVITAKSVFLTGRDLSGTWTPLSAFLFRYPPGEHQAELPYIIHLLFSAPFTFSILSVKIPFALMSVGIVFLLYKIAEKLFDRKAAAYTGVLAAINPWLIVMGRTGFEATPAEFFYLLFLYTVLTLTSDMVYLSIIPLVFGFYSYIGAKLIFVPYVILSLGLAYLLHAARYRKQYIVVLVLSILIVAGYALTLRGGIDSRTGELLLPGSAQVAANVDILRKNAIQSPVLSVFINKYTAYTDILLSKMFRIFSPSYLFSDGDQFFFPVKQGFFYVTDALIILLGALFLFARHRKISLFIFLFIMLGALPHVFHKTSGDFSHHLSLLFPFLILLAGYGASELLKNISGRAKPVIVLALLAVYMYNSGGFAVNYFYQFPLLDHGDFHVRILSHYLKISEKQSSAATVFTPVYRDVFKKYLFYSDVMNTSTIADIKKEYESGKPITYGGITFTSCNDSGANTGAAGLRIYDALCDAKIQAPHVRMVRLTDSGVLYDIVNDRTCSAFRLNPYPSGIRLSDFSIETLTAERFCKTYFN